MELSVFERLILLNILPPEGDFTTLKIVRQLKTDLSFSEEEHAALQFEQNEGTVKWLQEADIPKEIAIGEKATDIIVGVLKDLDKQKKLTEQHYSLFEKFIGD